MKRVLLMAIVLTLAALNAYIPLSTTSREAPCGREVTVELAWGPACHPSSNTSTNQKPAVVPHAFTEAELSEQFTVVILSMAQRVPMLKRVLRQYDGMPIIAEIIVVMAGLREDHLASHLGVTKTPISFVNNSINSLNNRFAVADKVKTKAVLANDDDLFFTPQSSAYLFRIWQKHRRSIVGSTARFSDSAAYLTRRVRCFNGVLTNSAFLPTELMREYFKPTGPAAQVRAHVDEHQNCEDIGINYVAAAAEQKMDPPVYVKIAPKLIQHSKGLSHMEDHYEERRACGSAFTGFFGGLRLPNITHTYLLQN